MEYLASFIDIVLHLDKHLALLVQQYGIWIYAILFAIIFSETGFVVTPFLPGDSLLFVAGALAALGGMDIVILLAVLVAAAAFGQNLYCDFAHFSEASSAASRAKRLNSTALTLY